MLGFHRDAVKFDNFACLAPHFKLAGEALIGLETGGPAKSPDDEPAKNIKRNPGDVKLMFVGITGDANVGASFVVPPRQKISFTQAVLRERVVDDRGGFVPQAKTGSENPETKFGVLTARF